MLGREKRAKSVFKIFKNFISPKLDESYQPDEPHVFQELSAELLKDMKISRRCFELAHTKKPLKNLFNAAWKTAVA